MSSKVEQSVGIYKDKPWDIVVGVFFLVLALAIGILLDQQHLFFDESEYTQRSSPVGELNREKGSVRYRVGKNPFWLDIAGKTKTVSQGDSIFTGSSGEATLFLDSGSEVRVLPNSLIVVQLPEKEDDETYIPGVWVRSSKKPTIEVKKGNVKVKVANKPLSIKAKDKEYQLKAENESSDVGINVSRSTVTFDVDKKAKVKIDQIAETGEVEELKVEAGQSASVTRRGTIKIQKVAVNLLGPLEGARVVQKTEIANNQEVVPVPFRWEISSEKNYPAQLEIFGRNKFQKKVAIDTKSDSAIVVLKPGVYKWRIKSKTKENSFQSTVQKIHVVGLTPPKVINPKDDIVFRTYEKQMILFKWARMDMSLFPEVELSNGSQNISVSAARNGASQWLPPGSYHWKIRVRDDSGKVSNWSSNYRFKIEKLKPTDTPKSLVSAPKIISEKPKVVVEPPKPKMVAKIKPKPKPIVKAKPKVTFEILAVKEATTKDLEKGGLSKSELDRAKKLQAAQQQKPKTRTPALTGSGPQKSSTRLSEGGSLNELPIVLSWKEIPGVKKYNIKIFDKADKVFREQTVEDPQFVFLLKSLKETNYKYQIHAKLASGEEISSPKIPIEIKMLPPLLKSPSSAKVFAYGGSVLMTWEKTSLTQEYHLQISSDSSFKSLVVDKIQTANFKSFKAPKSGTFYWRAKSLASGKESTWSDVGKMKFRE